VSAPQSRFRPLRANDMAGLIDLWAAAWAATPIAIDFEARRDWFREHLAALRLKGALVIVAAGEQGDILGFVTVDPGTGYLDQLCVDIRQRGGGLAKALLEEAKRHAPEDGLNLHVNVDNPRAQRFYEREGFEAIATGFSAMSGLPILHMAWRHGGASAA